MELALFLTPISIPTLKCKLNLVCYIENDRPPEITAEMGLRAKSICEAIYESNACNQVVDYEAVVSGEIEVYQKPINERWDL